MLLCLSYLDTFEPSVLDHPFTESLRAEFHQMFSAYLKEVLQPLKEEASIIKLWLARVANHLEHAETHGEHAFVSDLPELFGPVLL